MKRIQNLLWLLLLTACLEPYQPPDVGVDLKALVVDGFVDTGDMTARVLLSRTVPLSSTKPAVAEQNATVTIEPVGSSAFIVLRESQTTGGLYEASGVNLDVSKKYRLHIRTRIGKNYFSDPVELKKTPPIDSVFWEVKDDGVEIYVTTHDPTNRSRYYQWDFTETWHHRSYYESKFLIRDGQVIRRPANESIYNCWTVQPSTKILLGNSAGLSQDVINRYPLVFIPKGSIKISIKYSIVVRQRTLSETDYSFWQQLQKTTESVGGLFDPLPSQVTGNIHNIADATEPVLGHFGGGSISTSKRIFIDLRDDLPESFIVDPSGSCPLTPVGIPPDGLQGLNNLSLVTDVPMTTATAGCIDCRKDGGTVDKPDYWP